MSRRIDGDTLTVVKNIAGSFFVKGGSLVLSMLMLPAYIKFFNNETVLGIWYTALSILHWILFFDLGLGQGLRNQLPSAIIHDDIKMMNECISTTYIVMLCFSGILGIIGLFAIPRLNWNSILGVSTSVIDNRTLQICVIIVYGGTLLQLVLQTINYILYALQRSAVVNLISLLSNFLIYIFINIVPSMDIGRNLIGMAVINVISVNVPLIIVTIIVFTHILPDVHLGISLFCRKRAKDSFGVGVRLLWLQTVFMIVSSTNEFLITNLTGPENVVEYQAYRKVLSLIATVFSLAISPIWSAVTKAKVQERYNWIKNIYLCCILGVAFCGIISMLTLPYSQIIMDIWLGEGQIDVNYQYAVIIAISSMLSLLHNVNTSIGNGLSFFKVQMIWMSYAALIFIPLAYVMVQLTGSWIGVILANILSLLPYESLAPVFTFKRIQSQVK